MMADEKPEDAGLITPEEMEAAIESSGYLLEGRLGRVLSERGFFIEPNSFRPHPDDATKTIEVDAKGRYFEFVNEENKSTVTASVLVECKNNGQPVAFFVQPQQLAELNQNRILYSGFPAFSMDQETHIQERLHTLVEMKDWHHYCRTPEVATQFCSFTGIPREKRKGKDKWKAEPMNNYSKSFADIALMAAMDSEGAFSPQLQNIQVQLAYPIVVFQGPIYRVIDNQGRAKLEAASHIQLHHFASLNGQVFPVQIDVVTETAFPALVEEILIELQTFRDKINGMYDRLLNSALDQKSVARQNAARRSFEPYAGVRYKPRW